MSYSSEESRARASFVAAGDVPALQVGATTARFVAVGAETAERYGLFRWDMSATSGGAGPHLHRTFSEAFYILAGTVGVFDGTDWRDAGPGDFLYIPPGGVHGFRNESGAAASMLIIFAPGSPREAYFRELAELIDSGRRLGPGERAAFLARHDQYEV